MGAIKIFKTYWGQSFLSSIMPPTGDLIRQSHYNFLKYKPAICIAFGAIGLQWHNYYNSIIFIGIWSLFRGHCYCLLFHDLFEKKSEK